MGIIFTALYNIEAWYNNTEVHFWEGPLKWSDKGVPSGEVSVFMLPGLLSIRSGAGEAKTRNPKVRGSLVKTIIESLSVGFGVNFSFETA